MKKRSLIPVLFAAVLLAACGEETRNGQLTLSGSQPVRVVDQSGAAVEFVTGPLKVTFGADNSRQFTVELEQNGRKAKFSGQVPDTSDWNFTVRGRDIGQPVDFTSTRSLAMHGPINYTYGMGGPCGFNGTWETEEAWQKGTEDWQVAFNDAQSGGALGAFASRTEKDVQLSSRNVWCRERPVPMPHEPHFPHDRRLQDQLAGLQQNGVNFDSK